MTTADLCVFFNTSPDTLNCTYSYTKYDVYIHVTKRTPSVMPPYYEGVLQPSNRRSSVAPTYFKVLKM